MKRTLALISLGVVSISLLAGETNIFKAGVNITGLTSVTATDLENLINNATLAKAKGMVISSNTAPPVSVYSNWIWLNTSYEPPQINVYSPIAGIWSNMQSSVLLTSNNIADGSITSSKIADYAVTGIRLADDSVVNRTIQAGAITKNKIPMGEIAGTNLNLNSLVIGGTNIGAGSISNAHLASGAISGDKITTGSITVTNFDGLAKYSSILYQGSYEFYGFTARQTSFYTNTTYAYDQSAKYQLAPYAKVDTDLGAANNATNCVWFSFGDTVARTNYTVIISAMYVAPDLVGTTNLSSGAASTNFTALSSRVYYRDYNGFKVKFYNPTYNSGSTLYYKWWTTDSDGWCRDPIAVPYYINVIVSGAR